jgi:hypothetical protein
MFVNLNGSRISHVPREQMNDTNASLEYFNRYLGTVLD